jgi:signal peptidase I
MGLKRMFCDPVKYKILPYRHNYTRNGKIADTGFFIPAWRTVIHAMDERGVADENKAKAYYYKERERVKDDPEAYRSYCSEYCLVYEEAFDLGGNGIFDQALLAEANTNITILKSTPKVIRGNLIWKYKGNTSEPEGVVFKEDGSGDIYVTEPPVLDATGQPVKNLYVGGTDAIDLGVKDTSALTRNPSDFCQLIKKRVYGMGGDTYVCMYKKRPYDITAAYGNALRMLWWYGCKTNLEDSKIGFRSWLRDQKLDHRFLMKRPDYALGEKNRRHKSTLWGTPGNIKYIEHGLELIQQYVVKQWNQLCFIEMVEQLQNYSYEEKKKFDVVAAMIMAEIGDEDMYDKLVKQETDLPREWVDIGFYYDAYGRRRYGAVKDSGADVMRKEAIRHGWKWGV